MEALIASQVFQRALLEGTIAALLCSLVGYFMVLRAVTFAGEALTDIGFAGATGGVLLGFGPLWGMLGLGLLAAVLLGNLGDRVKGRDIDIGMILSFSLGLGVLFLSLQAQMPGSHAAGGVKLLFGSLLSVSDAVLWGSGVVAVVVLTVLAAVFRPLLFASIDGATARARGVSTRTLGVVFLLLLAAATAVSVQSMGVLLSSALLVGPAGAAFQWRRGPLATLGLAVALALAITWGGLVLAFAGPFDNAPVGFFICTLSALTYGISLLLGRRLTRVAPEEPAHSHHHHAADAEEGEDV